MEENQKNRTRERPAERFAAPTHLFDLQAIADQLRQEATPARDGHRQMSIYQHGLLTTVLFVFESGGQLPEHQADGEVTIRVVDGEVTVTADGESYDLSSAQLLALAPGVQHSVIARQPSVMLVTVCLQRNDDTDSRE